MVQALIRCVFAIFLFSAGSVLYAQSDEQSRVLPLNRFHFVASHDSSSVSPAWTHMETAVGDDYFDGTSSARRVRRHLKAARQLGVKYLRCAFSWNAIETSRGKYNWNFWDLLVREAQRDGIELIPYVAYTPKWAAASEEEFWSQPPRSSQLYADFMSVIVNRYSGRIRAWEIWNEPDNQEYWKGSVEGYADLVREAAIRMRQADASVVIVLGGMSLGPSKFYRSLIADQRIERYVDVIAMHGYPETWNQDRAEHVYQDWIREMNEMLANTSPKPDFWVNEMGYADYRFSPELASKWGIPVFYDYEHSREYAAIFLLKSEIMALASQQASLSVWYRLDDFSPDKTHFSSDEANYHLGLLDAQGKPKAAFFALKLFNRIFNVPVEKLATQVEREPDSQSRVWVFRTPENEFIVAAWIRSSVESEISDRSGKLEDLRREQVSISLPCKSVWRQHQYNAEGHSVPVEGIFLDGWLRKITLRGNGLFLATMECKQ